MAELQTALQWLGITLGTCLILAASVMLVAVFATGRRDWK